MSKTPLSIFKKLDFSDLIWPVFQFSVMILGKITKISEIENNLEYDNLNGYSDSEQLLFLCLSPWLFTVLPDVMTVAIS